MLWSNMKKSLWCWNRLTFCESICITSSASCILFLTAGIWQACTIHRLSWYATHKKGSALGYCRWIRGPVPLNAPVILPENSIHRYGNWWHYNLYAMLFGNTACCWYWPDSKFFLVHKPYIDTIPMIKSSLFPSEWRLRPGSVVVERSPGMREVGGSIPGRIKQKTLKFEVLLLCLAFTTKELETLCPVQSQHNGLGWDITAYPWCGVSVG